MKPPDLAHQYTHRNLYQSVLMIAVITILFACNNEQKSPVQEVAKKKVVGTSNEKLFSREELATAIKAMITPVDTLDSTFRKRRFSVNNAKNYAYLLNGYHPFWVEEEGITEASVQFIHELDSLRLDGLDPAAYNYPALAATMEKLKLGKPTLNEIAAFDTACTKSYLHASHDLLLGTLAPATVDDQWFHTNDTEWTAARTLAGTFFKEGKYPSLNEYRSKLPSYALMRSEFGRYTDLAKDENLKALKTSTTDKAIADTNAVAIISKEIPWLQTDGSDTLSAKAQIVRGFQNYYGLNPTGKIDSTTAALLARQPDSMLQLLSANMERMRWLPTTMENQYVLVNIPLMELFYRKGTENAFHMKVVVGKPSRQTPSFNANMANVVFSPPWGVPPTILKKEVIPGVAKRGGNYLARKGLKAYDRRGKQVSAASINSKNIKSLSFRQPPGARNALGEVKFNLPNKWDIYLHDTPHKDDFPRRYRAKSSGCVRVERPKDFAEFILSTLEGRNFNQEIIDSIIQTRRTRFEQLQHKIPVHLIYLTAFEDSTGQRLRFLPDIYKRDERLIAALKTH